MAEYVISIPTVYHGRLQPVGARPAGSVSTAAASDSVLTGRSVGSVSTGRSVAVQTGGGSNPSRATKEGDRRDSNPEPAAHEAHALSTRPQDVY